VAQYSTGADSAASLMMLDIDFFKHVNDTYGHLSGDQVLKVLGEVAQSVNRETDLLARLGGEEFAVFMPDTALTQAMEVAERLRLVLANTAIALPEGEHIQITVSIGVTSIQTTDSHIDDLLKRADIALYEAKNSGRNRVCQA
jgi:diguanylate cyclase (GGDEF)-like protein